MKLKISNTSIEINRINVVGGVNSSGKSTVSKLLYCYLKSLKDDESLDYLMDSEGISSLKDSDIEFENNDFIPSEVFYLDNISILDLKDLDFLKIDHIVHIKEALEAAGENHCEILTKIRKITDEDCLSTSSNGVKEIGIIELLLKNNQLKEKSFLIIDEPESSLHPDWQIRFAEILVMLSKEMNISLYLNSYSPIFIEAMSLYAEYYGMSEHTNFYLTVKCDDFNFTRIDIKNMAAVYENLTSPFDRLDRLKAKILFRE